MVDVALPDKATGAPSTVVWSLPADAITSRFDDVMVIDAVAVLMVSDTASETAKGPLTSGVNVVLQRLGLATVAAVASGRNTVHVQCNWPLDDVLFVPLSATGALSNTVWDVPASACGGGGVSTLNVTGAMLSAAMPWS